MKRTDIHDIYHEGELAAQQRAGEAQTARRNARAIGDRIPGGALRFIEQQPLTIVGSLDRQGRVWASVLTGPPGFLKACNAQSLELDVAQPRSATDDPLWRNLDHDPRVGLLFIELESRRRLRVNGQAHRLSDTHYAVDVGLAYFNCPKYIQRRHWAPPTDQSLRPSRASRRGARLTAGQREWIEGADTFFVASAHPGRGVDASHRGGRPGFVQAMDLSQLRVPDFAGNGMFNTLGNFVSYPHAGLVFVDFDGARVLQITGHPEILWDLDDTTEETGGTCRYWEFRVEAWQESELPLRLDWELLDYSPFSPSRQSSG